MGYSPFPLSAWWVTMTYKRQSYSMGRQFCANQPLYTVP
jgi:hypothetical protein